MIDPIYNRTKIVATLGPASNTRAVLTDMIRHGVDVFRLNASHGTHADHQQLIDLIRSINKDEGTHAATLLDLQGPKIRIGELDAPIPIQAGDTITFCTSIRKLEGKLIPMILASFATDVQVGDMVLVEDGKVMLEVTATDGKDTVQLLVRAGNSIGSRKGVNLPNVKLSIPSMTAKDLEDLELGVKNDVDWLALSFVRKAEDVIMLKQLLQEKGSRARVIAKIEKPEALQNLEAIILASDGIMVARGDLGVEIPIEDVPFWQKQIIRKCNEHARPVIVATQMLDSMIENPRPTRAEATDVANAVLDGTDAVMLSGETSTGKYPLEVIKTMQRIIAKAEQEESVYRRYAAVHEASPNFLAEAICLSACKMARGVRAKAIVSMTRSGFTAFQLSRHRPQAHIFIFTDNPALLSTLSLVWGVRAFYYDRFVGTNETIKDVIAILHEQGHLQKGDVVVNTAAMPLTERGRTNMLKLSVVE